MSNESGASGVMSLLKGRRHSDRLMSEGDLVKEYCMVTFNQSIMSNVLHVMIKFNPGSRSDIIGGRICVLCYSGIYSPCKNTMQLN